MIDLDQDIDSLSAASTVSLSTRVLNALHNDRIYTVRDLIGFTARDIQRIPNIGSKSVHEVRAWLAHYGLTLAGDPALPGSFDPSQEGVLTMANTKRNVVTNISVRYLRLELTSEQAEKSFEQDLALIKAGNFCQGFSSGPLPNGMSFRSFMVQEDKADAYLEGLGLPIDQKWDGRLLSRKKE